MFFPAGVGLVVLLDGVVNVGWHFLRAIGPDFAEVTVSSQSSRSLVLEQLKVCAVLHAPLDQQDPDVLLFVDKGEHGLNCALPVG